MDARNPTNRAETAEPAEEVRRGSSSAAQADVRRVWTPPKWVQRLGSLYLAVTLLPSFAVALFIGILVESRYDAVVSDQLVYRTWWFLGLLLLLAVNIFFAAVKKWPWQRHQLGFLITHLGLLTLVASGVVNAFGVTQGIMMLVDSPSPEAARFGLHEADFLIDRHHEIVRVFRPDGRELIHAVFKPAPLPWGAKAESLGSTPRWIAILDRLAHPWPRRWRRKLPDGGQIEVLAYYPHTRQEPYRPASANSAAFPAVQLRLGSKRFGFLPPRWLAYHDDARSVSLGPGRIDFAAAECNDGQLREFLHPPPASALGTDGQLVIGWNGTVRRIDVASHLEGSPIPLGDHGWTCRLLQYLPNYRHRDDTSARDPAVAFELTDAEGHRIGLAITARRGGDLFPLPGYRWDANALANVWAWYHPPDYGYGEGDLRGLLQLATDAHGRLYYRSLTRTESQPWGVERSGRIETGGKAQPIWPAMGGSFDVLRFLPNAIAEPYFIPVDSRGRSPDMLLTSALLCRLSYRGEKVEFWIGKTDAGWQSVFVGGQEFRIGYNSTLHRLGFSVKLLRAEQTTDPGTGRPAGQSSLVLIKDDSREERRVITLNQPLSWHSHLIYQSGYNEIGTDAVGRPIRRSVLTVNRDPGLPLKYAGSVMVALGIACMFYMRAYFFRRRVPGG